MLKKIIEYTDYNGVARKETFYFNLTKAELLEMHMEVDGGMQQLLEQILEKKDIPKIMANFKTIILRSYGEKSPDGRRFIKSKELSDAFTQTEAYNVLYMELLSDGNKAAEFINGIMPADLPSSNANEVLTPINEDTKKDGDAHLLNK